MKMQKPNENRKRLLNGLAIGCAVALLVGAAGGTTARGSEQEAQEELKRKQMEAQAAYEEAVRMLDDGQYREAAAAFREAAARMRERSRERAERSERHRDRTDAALYWQGYALSKMGAYDRAIEVYRELRNEYPGSAWLDDAEALEAEMLASARERTELEEDEQLRLMALQSLAHTDPDRAVPLLEKFLQGERSSPAKERALFLLIQTGSPNALAAAEDIVLHDDDLRLRVGTVRHIGIIGGERGIELLSEIYESTDETEIKEAILHGFMVAGHRERLLDAAEHEELAHLRRSAVQALGHMGAAEELEALIELERSEEVKLAILEAYMMSGEKDRVLRAAKGDGSPEVRRSAIHLLSMMGGKDEIWDLFQSENDIELREAMLETMVITGDVDHLAAAAGMNLEPRLRVAAIRALGIAGEEVPTDQLLAIYEKEKDREIRAAALEGFLVHGDVEALVRIARTETDRELKAEAVRYLAMSDSEEAKEFLLEFLSE
jgi:HEAT repeat protein